MSKHAIWGFTIEVSPSGRKIWPNKLKYEAARRIREDGLSPGVTVPYLIRFCGFSSFWGVFVPLITIFPQASRLRI